MLRYLAYGSNLLPSRLQARVPSARCVGTVALEGWSLEYHKVGLDGSGKCNLVERGGAGGRVHCAVYDIEAQEKPALDRAEGPRYFETTLPVRGFGEVFLYLAREAFIDEALHPYSWYRALVVAGARHHGFPVAYVRRLGDRRCIEDPDRDRHEENLEILSRSFEA